jgi:ribosomal protein RSM22 (predicted rRNA methylase)
LTSNFAILFSLFGLGAAFQDIADRKETEKSASRIFSLLDRVSSIDPLSEEGKILDTSGDMPMKSQRKLDIKRNNSTKKMTKQQKRESSMEDVDE